MIGISELLSTQYIVEQIKDKSPQEQLLILAELKQEAKRYSVTREFNAIVKIAKDEANKPTYSYTLMQDIPQAIQNTAGYDVTELGIFLPLQHGQLEVCPYPIFPVERYKDIEDGTEKVKLTFKRDHKWHTLIQSRSILSSASKITQLADNATGINSENAKAVVRYLSDIESANRDTIPQQKSVSHLGWTDYGFVPFIDDITFTGADQYGQLYNKFHEHGDFNTWHDLHVKCMRYDLPKIIIASSYASLLLRHVGVNGFCVHLWGESGRGKTVALMLGASIYGDTDPKNGIIRNGKTTSNGIEPVLAFFKDVPVYFDELTTLSQDQITDMVYKFAQGQGKGRMNKNAGLQKTYTWNNIAILSAEKPLSDARTQSGAVNRVISLYTAGKVFGDMDMVDIVSTLRKNYGFGAKRFIEAIKHEDIDRLYSTYLAQIPERIEQKQANAAALILTAYDIACRRVYNVDNNLSTETIVAFLAGKDDVSYAKRAYNELLSWVDANYTYFDDSDIQQSKWGAYGNNKQLVHIFYARFVDWCAKNNYQPKALLREWRNTESIKVRSKNEYKNNATIKGKSYSDVITINIPIERYLKELEESATEDLPF